MPKWGMPKWGNTLFGKISLVFCALLLLLAGLQVLLTFHVWRRSLEKAEQTINWDTAPFLAGKMSATTEKALNWSDLERLSEDFRRANPKVSIYLLRNDGKIQQRFLSDAPAVRDSVAIEPIHRFLAEGASKDSPIRGDDPSTRSSQTIFSAAPVHLGSESFILYIILSSESWRNVSMIDYEDAIVMSGIFWSLLSVLATAMVGIVLFRLLTRRFRHITQTVQYFHKGDFSPRIGLSASDELGLLGSTLDEMAIRIEDSFTKLKERDALRRELIANISHDLRGPVSNIQGNYENLERSAGHPPSAAFLEQFREAVGRNLEYLTDLLNQLFELAKLEAQETKPDFEDFPIDQLLDDLVIGYRTRANAHGIQIATEFEERPVFVHGDIRLLDRVLMNLLENALKFTPQGGRIKLGVKIEDEFAKVFISDTGKGIAKEELPRVMEKFFQGTGASKSKGSAGLGLAIVERLVKLHDASIQISSSAGEGTSISFRLKRTHPQ